MGSFSLFHWLIAAGVLFALYKIIKSMDSSTHSAANPAFHCMTCGTDGPGKTRTRGSIAIEIILWLCFLVPGLVYSIWRLTTRREVCTACGSETIVPFSAPAAISHRQQLESVRTPIGEQRGLSR
jgi:hypothetical protein